MNNNQSELYNVLGISKESSPSQIKRAYMKLARIYHPDKNPSAGDKFKEITTAYDILSDDTKRKIYDQFGMLGIREGIHNNTQQREEMFPSSVDLKKGPSVKHLIQISLEDSYNGKTLEIEMQRKRICSICNGIAKGSTCKTCNGKGIKSIKKQIKQGLYHNSSIPCKDCMGSGKNIPISNRCSTCKGRLYITKPYKFNVYIDRGMQNDHSIIFQGEGDHLIDYSPGDVIFIISFKKHSMYTLDGINLHTTIDISLKESLLGFSYLLKLLDGREVIISSNSSEIIKQGDIRIIEKEGFPKYKSPLESGDLYIHFNIIYPKKPFTEEEKKILNKILPTTIQRNTPKEHNYQIIELSNKQKIYKTNKKEEQECYQQ